MPSFFETKDTKSGQNRFILFYIKDKMCFAPYIMHFAFVCMIQFKQVLQSIATKCE